VGNRGGAKEKERLETRFLTPPVRSHDQTGLGKTISVRKRRLLLRKETGKESRVGENKTLLSQRGNHNLSFWRAREKGIPSQREHPTAPEYKREQSKLGGKARRSTP